MSKFKIEDEVIFKGTRGKKKIFSFRGLLSKEEIDKRAATPAQVFRVTDVKTDTCYGGTQVHYNLRPMMYGEGGAVNENAGLVGVHEQLFTAREIELEKAE